MIATIKYGVPLFVFGVAVAAAQQTIQAPIVINAFEVLDVVSILTAFFVIAVLIERCVEVAMTLIFARRQAALNQEVAGARAVLAEKEVALERQLAMTETPDERVAMLSGVATKVLANATAEVAIRTADVTRSKALEKGSRTVAAVSLSMLLGLMVTVAGFRMLSPLACTFTGLPCEGGELGSLMAFADVVTTTLVIAGGADGVHAVMKKILGASSDS